VFGIKRTRAPKENFRKSLYMNRDFLLFTTFFFTFVTITEAFQITKIFNLQSNNPQSSEMATEQTFIAVKPDGVMRGLVGEIIGRFEKRGYHHSLEMLIIDSSLLR
jgi:hypothetical protein